LIAADGRRNVRHHQRPAGRRPAPSVRYRHVIPPPPLNTSITFNFVIGWKRVSARNGDTVPPAPILHGLALIIVVLCSKCRYRAIYFYRSKITCGRLSNLQQRLMQISFCTRINVADCIKEKLNE